DAEFGTRQAGHRRTEDIGPRFSLLKWTKRKNPVLFLDLRQVVQVVEGKTLRAFQMSQRGPVLENLLSRFQEVFLVEEAGRPVDLLLRAGFWSLALTEDVAQHFHFRRVVKVQNVLSQYIRIQDSHLALPDKLSDFLEHEGSAPTAPLPDIEDGLHFVFRHHDIEEGVV